MKLKDLIESNGKNLNDFALALGIPSGTLRFWNSKNSIAQDKIEPVAKELGISSSELLKHVKPTKTRKLERVSIAKPDVRPLVEVLNHEKAGLNTDETIELIKHYEQLGSLWQTVPQKYRSLLIKALEKAT